MSDETQDNGTAESTTSTTTKDKKRPTHDGVSRADQHTCLPERLTIIGIDTKDGPEHPLFDGQSNAYELEADKIQNYYHNGVLQAVKVRRDGDRFIVVFGRKRCRYLRAANALRVKDGLPPMKITFTITTASDEALVGMVMMENLVRTEATFRQKAEMAQRLIEGWGYSPEDVGQSAGVSLATVNSWLKFNNLAEPVKREVDNGLAATSALYLSDLPREDQVKELADLKVKAAATGKKLTVRNVRAAATKNAKKGRIAITHRELRAFSASDQWGDAPSQVQEAILAILGDADIPKWLKIRPGEMTARVEKKAEKPKNGKNGKAKLFADDPADAPPVN